MTNFVPNIEAGRGHHSVPCGNYDCRYYSSYTDSCDYMARTSQRRGCPAAKDCFRYEKLTVEEKIRALREKFKDHGTGFSKRRK